jgi:hypothetical protein
MNNKEKLYLAKQAGNQDLIGRVNDAVTNSSNLIARINPTVADTLRSNGMDESEVKEHMETMGRKYEEPPLLPFKVRDALGTSYGKDFLRGDNPAAYGIPAGVGALAGGTYGLLKDPDEEEDESRIGNAVSGAGWGGALGLAGGAGLANYKQPLG